MRNFVNLNANLTKSLKVDRGMKVDLKITASLIANVETKFD